MSDAWRMRFKFYGAPRKGIKTMTKISAFLNDEAGAVTVDWVVLTAAIVGLGLLIFSYVRPAVSNVAEQIGVELEDAKSCMTSNGKTC
jgi:Flp pilus assembly pilin Flp